MSQLYLNWRSESLGAITSSCSWVSLEVLNESSSESALFLRLALTDLLSEDVFCLDVGVLLCFRHCEVTDCRRAVTPAMATSVGMLEAGRPRLLVSALRDCVTMTGAPSVSVSGPGVQWAQYIVHCTGRGYNCTNKVHPPTQSQATLIESNISTLF